MELGTRLRAERNRLGLSQGDFGELGGVKALAQRNYESGSRSPDAKYLAAIAAAGADVQYIVTGHPAISAEQVEREVALYGDAWETLELALLKAKKSLPPDRKRRAAEAIYRAAKGQSASKLDIAAIVLELAA